MREADMLNVTVKHQQANFTLLCCVRSYACVFECVYQIRFSIDDIVPGVDSKTQASLSHTGRGIYVQHMYTLAHPLQFDTNERKDLTLHTSCMSGLVGRFCK